MSKINKLTPAVQNDERMNAFWDWFKTKEKGFYNAVKNQRNIEVDFFDHISPRLQAIQEGIYFLTGMLDKNTVELILTPDGNLKNIVFVEELVAHAPEIRGWQFTALKPPTNIENASIEIGDYKFGASNIHFYPKEYPLYPDEIDLTIVYDKYEESGAELIMNGVYIFIDNYLGELKSVTLIDNVDITGPDEVDAELIPITKLNDFLVWREKEFVEKYEEKYRQSGEDQFTLYEAELENGLPLIASMNSALLNWDFKPSHPYIARILISYDAVQNGMPSKETYALITDLEDRLFERLLLENGYLHIGQQTGDGMREIYFVGKEFREFSKIIQLTLHEFQPDLQSFYEIYKDKYWQSFERYRTVSIE